MHPLPLLPRKLLGTPTAPWGTRDTHTHNDLWMLLSGTGKFLQRAGRKGRIRMGRQHPPEADTDHS